MMRVIKKIVSATLAITALLASAVTCLADSIFYENGYYYTFINNDSVSLTGWDGSDSVLSVPAMLNNRPLVAIPKHAFMGNSIITGLELSNAVNLKTIGMYAFSECSALTEKLLLPENITYIGDCAFEECSQLSEVEINSSVSYIPIQCFNRCESLESVVINGAEEIDSYAFANCPNLSKVIIGDSVTEINDTAFDNDPNLKIYGFANSYAQTYAQEHNIPFVEMVKFLLGDVDGVDGVNINDVTAIQSLLAELKTVEGVYLLAADANQDDVVDISDATAIQMKLAEYDLPYPIGQYVTKEVVTQENN